MDTDLALTSAVAGVALVAALLADVLPGATSAAALRRRATRLQVTVVAILAAVVAGILTDHGVRAALVLAVPAIAVGFVSLRRLNRVRRGAAAFATAPHTPAPPGLRAAAAHPLLVLPIQVTALASIAATLTMAGVVSIAVPAVLGVVLTTAGLAVTGIGVRLALRHSRLAESVVAGAVAGPGRRSARAVGVLQV